MEPQTITLTSVVRPCPVCSTIPNPPEGVVCGQCGGARGWIIGWRTPCATCHETGSIRVTQTDPLSGGVAYLTEPCPECHGESVKIWSVHVAEPDSDDSSLHRIVEMYGSGIPSSAGS